MEDLNTVATDCVAISCCCQCLVLQILFFVFLQLPCRFVRKTKEYVKKKIRRKRKERKMVKFDKEDLLNIRLVEELLSSMDDDGDDHSGLGFHCMKEVERVLEEFSERGEFAFGSFWGRREDKSGSRSSSTPSVDSNQEFDFSLIQFEYVEIVASLSCPEHS